jgi:hypothetical protein
MNNYSKNGIASLDSYEVRASALNFADDFMDVHLEDGRILRIPLDWFPRLQRATEAQRKKFKWQDGHRAMHWPSVDEDISIHGLLRGQRAPRTRAYLEGFWSDDVIRQRKEIEAKDRAKRTLLRAPRKKAVKAKH